MLIEDVLTELINDKMTSVWFYPTTDSGGAKLFQLLDEYGGELAWRWVSDGDKRWRDAPSSLSSYSERPVCAVEYDLTEGLENVVLTLGITDTANGSVLPPRPDWCR
ncbi:hypothetical protein [Rahnella aceris]|uniref:hypothetical protein n=1 Tax=Rahnella sp. (strain Y9602) TaxID=2703885 RepID=UPI003B9F0934